jgi:hypothetical protein
MEAVRVARITQVGKSCAALRNAVRQRGQRKIMKQLHEWEGELIGLSEDNTCATHPFEKNRAGLFVYAYAPLSSM